VALVDPKFPHNVGAAVRAASCYGARQVWFSGDRVRLDGAKRQRLPREERMRGSKEVEVRHADRSFDAFEDAVPVAVELRNAESLIDFVHPEHALYLFGPEDGSLGRATLLPAEDAQAAVLVLRRLRGPLPGRQVAARRAGDL
jgi:tRNA(Leu) C34 or U34 (ribose-2'-O)-methylase TrmL